MHAIVQHTVLAAEPAASGTLMPMHVLFLVPLLAYVVLVVGALVSIVSARQDTGMKLVWVVFVLIAPFVGSLLWFLVGRSHARRTVTH
ncbi:MAG TPA: PLD nuclease N-terminal domain-containing protein [Streptosporangiaceae bacterium]|jgi:membrane protein DedA with SNARE-associated domain